MNEPLFETQTCWSYAEFKKYCFSVMRRSTSYIVGVIITCVAAALGALYTVDLIMKNIMVPYAVILLILMLALPSVTYIFPARTINKRYMSNTLIDPSPYSIFFYKDGFSAEEGETLSYDKIYKIYETKTNFYIMLSSNMGINIIKANCSDELIEFLSALKVKVDGVAK